MHAFIEYTDTPLNVTIREDSSFFVVNKDKRLIFDPVLLRAVTKEIDNWNTLNAPGSFIFQYSIQSKGELDKRPFPHEHQFVQIDNAEETDKTGKRCQTKIYRIMKREYKCEICAFTYKTEIKQLL